VSDWKEALAPTPDCLPLDRLGDALTPDQQAHVAECVRCQTELALHDRMMNEESSPESQWIAGELRRNNKSNVIPFRPRMGRVLSAVAAAIVLLLGAGTWLRMREQAVEVDMTPGTYRSARLELLTPGGDVAQPPNELRWTAVPDATLYRVHLLEVDATEIWSAGTAETHIVLPPQAVAEFKPGKSLRWNVSAYRGNEQLMASQTQMIRVTPQ
jgi:hypothetical protein